MTQKPDICIFHSPCPDGFTAAWAVWTKYGDDVEYIEGKYGDPVPDVSGKHVLMVDFSYKRDVMVKMYHETKSVTILDHHLSAEKELDLLLEAGHIDGVFDMNKSGARLAWEWAHPDTPIPTIVRHVEDRDLWRFHLPDTEAFCAWLDMQPRAFKDWSRIDTDLQRTNLLNQVLTVGAALVQKFNKDADGIMRSTLQWFEIDGHKVPVCNAPYIYASRIGNELIKRDDAPFGATFFINPEGAQLYSLRSCDSKVNVSEVAVKFGGGGHRNASGFRVPPDHKFTKVDMT